MPIYRASVIKGYQWRGKEELFGNVYTLFNAGATIEADALLNKLADLEQPLYAPAVNFREGRVWIHVKGNKAASLMLHTKQFSGRVGTLSGGIEIYRELAVLMQWPLGRYGAKNRPQFLRKWHHTMRVVGYDASDVLGDVFTGVTPTVYRTYMDSVDQFSTAAAIDGDFFLATEDNRRPTGQGEIYPYLEHRQFRRGPKR